MHTLPINTSNIACVMCVVHVCHAWTMYVELDCLRQGDGDAIQLHNVHTEPCIRGGGGGDGVHSVCGGALLGLIHGRVVLQGESEGTFRLKEDLMPSPCQQTAKKAPPSKQMNSRAHGRYFLAQLNQWNRGPSISTSDLCCHKPFAC